MTLRKKIYSIFYLVCLLSMKASFAMEDLIEKGKKDRNGSMPWLFKLIREGKGGEINAIKTAIVSCGADVNEVYQNSTPLNEAVKVGSKPLVRMLHHYGARLKPIPEMYFLKQTQSWISKVEVLDPLKKAVQCESLSMVKLLVDELGAEPDYADKFYEETALYIAAAMAQQKIWNREKLVPIISFLHKRGADHNKPNCRGLTPLKQAEMTKDSELVKLFQDQNLLTSKQAEIKISETTRNLTEIDLAADEGICKKGSGSSNSPILLRVKRVD